MPYIKVFAGWSAFLGALFLFASFAQSQTADQNQVQRLASKCEATSLNSILVPYVTPNGKAEYACISGGLRLHPKEPFQFIKIELGSSTK